MHASCVKFERAILGHGVPLGAPHMIRDALRTALQQALATAGLPEPPRPASSWIRPDNATTVTGPRPSRMAVTKQAGRRNPREVAEEIKAALEAAAVPHLDRVEIAGPGFLNLFLAPSWLADVLREVVAAGDRFGTSDVLQGRRINLEFVSANPTGPLHAGGGRWVAVGDAIANLLAAQGAEVHREYYLNDAGGQLGKFRDSLWARYRGEQPPDDGYQGHYLVDMAAELRAELGDDVDPDTACEWGYRKIVAGLQDDLGRIGVHFDTWFSERDAARARRRRRDPRRTSTARGSLYEADGATWLRSTDFGDTARSRARPFGRRHDLSRATTSRTTATSSPRGFTHLIDIWGADHHGQVAVVARGYRGARLPPGRAGDPARTVRQARRRTGTRSASRSGPATSSRSPTSSTRSIPTSRA